MKVRANGQYIYYPNLLDRCDGRTSHILRPGDIVKVVNLHGAPKANTMQHAHIEFEGRFVGLVHCNSLYSFQDKQLVIDALKRDAEKVGQ